MSKASHRVKRRRKVITWFSAEDPEALWSRFWHALLWQLIPYALLCAVFVVACYVLIVGDVAYTGMPLRALLLSLSSTDASVAALVCALQEAVSYGKRKGCYKANAMLRESCDNAKLKFVIFAIIAGIESCLLARMFVIAGDERPGTIAVGIIAGLVLTLVAAFMNAHYELKLSRLSSTE